MNRTPPPGPDRRWLSAHDAARALGVTRATLYAYVSRGFVRSEVEPGAPRTRRYARDDVERLRRRTEERRDPDKAAAHALQWGMPVLESAITLIAGSSLYYRGHDAVELARTTSIGDVAALLWTGRVGAGLSAAPGLRRPVPRGRLPFVARAQAALALASAGDPLAYDLRPAAVAACGQRILDLLARVAASSDAPSPTIDGRLARAWRVPGRGADLLRAALILCADHELNVSAFTARAVASAGSSPYAVVIAGLAALEGSRHGGATVRVEAMLDSLGRGRGVAGALARRLQRGEAIDGFGHPLYPNGDPRAIALLEMLRSRYARSGERAHMEAVAGAAAALVRERPTVDFALVALARVLRLPPGAPLMLFALGRTVGWIGHAIEQYETGQIIRPRAKYVGRAPERLGTPPGEMPAAGARRRRRGR